ncbi:hypothetical protein Nepgr_023978 [Nepenthes gracilis]|uniref:Uncharacterized protein n=1 Tax=Nepenthes gracilis TaxID=150966 RepID=A0AAD3T3G8_NEPGR|nr:hypothetical protein Nepgr_023978 [Nepenthes gracilis]
MQITAFSKSQNSILAQTSHTYKKTLKLLVPTKSKTVHPQPNLPEGTTSAVAPTRHVARRVNPTEQDINERQTPRARRIDEVLASEPPNGSREQRQGNHRTAENLNGLGQSGRNRGLHRR